MSRRWLIALGVIGVVGGAAVYGYVAGPERAAVRWLDCNSGQDVRLLSSADREFWDEWIQRTTFKELEAYRRACLGTHMIGGTTFAGRTATVQYTHRSPDLSWGERTDFPVTATLAERVRLIRERAAAAKQTSERSSELKLRIEGLAWRVLLNLEPVLQRQRILDEAQEHRESGEYDLAVALYEQVLAEPDLDEHEAENVTDFRLAALAAKACRAAAQDYVKYPSSAEYNFDGWMVHSESQLLITGGVLAQNAFGAKSELLTTCTVTFDSSTGAATVDLLMVPEGGGSMVSEEGIQVDL